MGWRDSVIVFIYLKNIAFKKKIPFDNSSSNYNIIDGKWSFTHLTTLRHKDTNTHIASSGFMWVNPVFLASLLVCVAGV